MGEGDGEDAEERRRRHKLMKGASGMEYKESGSRIWGETGAKRASLKLKYGWVREVMGRTPNNGADGIN
jgi:hypothetical protein